MNHLNIYQNIKWKAITTDKIRQDIPEIPEQAIREIVINAFAHAQYESNTEHEISIFNDRIEIYNPGTFPINLTPIDFINKNRKSIIRNKLIADILFRSKYVEKGGSGFQKVDKLCSSINLSWNYNIDNYGFSFIFYRTNYVNQTTTVFKRIDNAEEKVYEIISNNPQIKKDDIAKQLNKSGKTVQRAISNLVKKKLIVRVGNYKNGYWKIDN